MQIGKVSKNKNTNKPRSHSAEINKWLAGTNYLLTYGPGARTGQVGNNRPHLRTLVSWSLTSLFSTNMAVSETKGQGWKVIRTQWRKASDILTSTLAAFLFSSHPKKGKESRDSVKLLRKRQQQGRQLLAKFHYAS